MDVDGLRLHGMHTADRREESLDISPQPERGCDGMRRLQRSLLVRGAVAFALGALFSSVAWHLGSVIAFSLLVALLTLVVFAALTIAPDAIAHWRRHPWRWWWRTSEDDGPFWLGTRIPRHPRPPFMPSNRAMAKRDEP